MRLKNRIAALLILVLILIPCLRTYALEELSTDVKAGIIVETNTGKVIYEKDSEEKNYPASVTKILTAIIVLENCNLDDVATASKTALSNIPVVYVTAPLSVGEEMRIEDLLYALMLKSANDAAYVLAEHVGGTIEGFSDMMNKKAEELGCKNSHFVNPNGIHDENHYTSAYDMYLIANYAMKNEEFVKIVSTYEYTLPATNKYKAADRIMQNTNSFVDPKSSYYDESVKGIKTGTTTQAGNCLITDVSRDGLNFINVVLGAKTANSKFTETSKMIDYEFENYMLSEMNKKSDMIQTIEVEKATKDTKNLELVIDKDITVLHNKEISKDNIKPEIKINEGIVAPIQEGQELGTITYTVEGIEYNAKLIAASNVDKKTYEKEIAIGIICFIVLILIIRIINVKRRKNRKNRR